MLMVQVIVWTRITYSAFDGDPFNDVSYYRLKQTDFDGKFIYSSLVGY